MFKIIDHFFKLKTDIDSLSSCLQMLDNKQNPRYSDSLRVYKTLHKDCNNYGKKLL